MAARLTVCFERRPGGGREFAIMRCQDCGAPCESTTIVCPFCSFEVGLQRVSDRQRRMLRWANPLVRLLVLMFLLLFLLSGADFANLGCCGNIGG